MVSSFLFLRNKALPEKVYLLFLLPIAMLECFQKITQNTDILIFHLMQRDMLQISHMKHHRAVSQWMSCSI